MHVEHSHHEMIRLCLVLLEGKPARLYNKLTLCTKHAKKVIAHLELLVDIKIDRFDIVQLFTQGNQAVLFVVYVLLKQSHCNF